MLESLVMEQLVKLAHVIQLLVVNIPLSMFLWHVMITMIVLLMDVIILLGALTHLSIVLLFWVINFVMWLLVLVELVVFNWLKIVWLQIKILIVILVLVKALTKQFQF